MSEQDIITNGASTMSEDAINITPPKNPARTNTKYLQKFDKQLSLHIEIPPITESYTNLMKTVVEASGLCDETAFTLPHFNFFLPDGSAFHGKLAVRYVPQEHLLPPTAFDRFARDLLNRRSMPEPLCSLLARVVWDATDPLQVVVKLTGKINGVSAGCKKTYQLTDQEGKALKPETTAPRRIYDE